MTPAELHECLATLHWSRSRLAEALNHPTPRAVDRWLAGRYPVPETVATWLRNLTIAVNAAYDQNPAPQSPSHPPAH